MESSKCQVRREWLSSRGLPQTRKSGCAVFIRTAALRFVSSYDARAALSFIERFFS